MSNEQVKHRGQDPVEPRRKPYETPSLRLLGSVRDLTLTGGASTSDGTSSLAPQNKTKG